MHQRITIIVLVILLCILAIIAGKGGITDATAKEVFVGVAISILASVFCLIAFWSLGKVDTESLLTELSEIVERHRYPHITRIDRNVNMGQEYWLDLIGELDSSEDPAWFVGTQLTLWLRPNLYHNRLREQLVKRFRNMCTRRGRGKRAHYETYILVGNRDSAEQWKDCIRKIFAESCDGLPGGSSLARIARERIHVGVIPLELLRYSLVLCGTRMAVTAYTSTGRSEDSPTLDVRWDSAIWRLYRADMQNVKERIQYLDVFNP